MNGVIDKIPDGLQTDFLRETESNTMPAIRREGRNIIIPALIRREGDVYRYFEVPVPFTGQDISDYDKCLIQSYAELRRFFYGPAAVQMEQQLKGTFAAHQYAVKMAFPKKAGEVPAAVARFEEIKTGFWNVIDGVLVKIGKSREDLPAQPFNAETMLAWALANGISTADIAEAATELTRISLDLLHNGRNWNELFL